MFTGIPYCKKLCLNFIYIILNVLFLHIYIPEWYNCCIKQFSKLQLYCFVFLSAVFLAKFYTHFLNIGLQTFHFMNREQEKLCLTKVMSVHLTERSECQIIILTLHGPQHNIYVNCHTQLQTKVMLFFPVHSSCRLQK